MEPRQPSSTLLNDDTETRTAPPVVPPAVEVSTDALMDIVVPAHLRGRADAPAPDAHMRTPADLPGLHVGLGVLLVSVVLAAALGGLAPLIGQSRVGLAALGVMELARGGLGLAAAMLLTRGCAPRSGPGTLDLRRVIRGGAIVALGCDGLNGVRALLGAHTLLQFIPPQLGIAAGVLTLLAELLFLQHLTVSAGRQPRRSQHRLRLGAYAVGLCAALMVVRAVWPGAAPDAPSTVARVLGPALALLSAGTLAVILTAIYRLRADVGDIMQPGPARPSV